MSTKYFALLTQLGADKLANAAALGTKIEITHMAVGDGGGKLPTPDTKQTKLINEKRRAAINTLSIDPKNTNQIIAEQVIPESEGGWWIREIGLYDKDGILIAVGNCAETYKPQLQEGSGRTQTIRMILIVSSANAVTLKVDPSVILATREYVDDSIKKHANSRNHPDATLKEKGFVILSSAVDSNSETHAATPKAVKTAYDLAKAADNNANGRVPAGRKVNGKALSADIALNAGDVGAYNTAQTDAKVSEARSLANTANQNAANANNNANTRLGKNKNGADIPNKDEFVKNLGLAETVDLAKNAVPKSSITQYSGNSDKLLMSQQVVTSLIDERVTKTEFQKLLNTKVETGWINKNFLEKNPKELEDTNLQDVLEQGWYCQRWSVNSTPERNYPIQEFGMLEVLPSDSYDTWFVQRFTAGHSLNTYVRKIIKNDQSKDLVAATEWKRYLMTSENINGVISDVNGNLRQSSPIIQIYPTGTFITNDESEGASVSRIDIGQYKVTGVMGYNSDGAWGIHGGISSPKNNNGLELIYISDKVQKDGSIIIETFHRQHLHLPEKFQNKRIKTMFEGKLIYYAEGEPCDIPDGCRLDVRVQMPKDSVWNLNQNKLHKEIENSER